MNVIDQIRTKASKVQKTIVLPRSSDERVLKAASFLTEEKLCKVILIQNDSQLEIPSGIEVINPKTSPQLDLYAESFFQKRKHKGITLEMAKNTITDPLYFGASMVANGNADACIAGSVSTTGDVLRAAIQTIGLKAGSSVVSSIFLMSFDDGKVFSFGDCAVVPYPTAPQLATIAQDSANSHEAITGTKPNVAMLSFATKGSAKHERVDLVEEAFNIASSHNPELNIDGSLQFDAAYVESIGQSKAPKSNVAGKANVFIFPNLDAGNIGYKITERLGGATATGPIIQGLDKPMLDLSRGCTWQDIVNTSCVAALLN